MSLIAYIKTVWSDRAVQFPRRYRDQLNNQYTFTPDEGTITNAGTPSTATRLNNLENGVEAVTTEVIAHQADYTLQVPYGGTTTGVANTYAIATPVITALTTGMAVSVKFNLDSSGASTLNWNGKGAKGIKKANGTDATTLKATGIYTLRYDGTNFILQGEGASGNAIASDLLSGKTAEVGAGDIVGTMPNKVGSATVITPSGADQIIPQGYYDGVVGSGKVAALTITAGDSLLLANTSILSGGGTAFTKKREIQTDTAGVYRIRFGLKIFDGAAVGSGQIYKNGVAYGTIRQTTSQTYVTFTEDLAFSVGDLIQLYTADPSGNTTYTQNFNFSCAINYPTLTVNL